MSTDSDTTRAIDRRQTNPLLFAVVVLTLVFASGCSMSLVDKTPEILRYCRVADRSEVANGTGAPDTAGQTAPPTGNEAANGCAGGADRVCEDDEIADAVTRGEPVNCLP